MQMQCRSFITLILLVLSNTLTAMEKNNPVKQQTDTTVFPLIAHQLITLSHTRCGALEAIHPLSLVNKSIRKELYNHKDDLNQAIAAKIGYENLVDGDATNADLANTRKAILRAALEEETTIKEREGYTFLYKDTGIFKINDVLAYIEHGDTTISNEHINNILNAYSWSLKRYNYELSATLLGLFKQSVRHLADNDHLQKTYSDVIKPSLTGYSPRIVQLSLKTGKDLFGSNFFDIPGLKSKSNTIDSFIDLYKKDDPVIASLVSQAIIKDIRSRYVLNKK
ncbi:MAG: hypothetical protein ACOYT8_05565 [Candidatus Dependentiae bacterium]